MVAPPPAANVPPSGLRTVPFGPVTGFLWRLRRAFWNGLAVLKFHGQKPEVIPSGAADPRPVRLVPFVTKYPDIPIDGVVVADHIPTDEADTPKRLFTRFQHKLVQWFSPMQEGLPPIAPDPDAALARGVHRGRTSGASRRPSGRSEPTSGRWRWPARTPATSRPPATGRSAGT